ncbi:hypothetical protein J4E83_004821 [Alternaria metachromatica]|uniref:uncharacterized protein n=1 Tax=Alternaria metachromatica TaxID=283354 RepID=UPI0020C21F4B|nr:uncharacterized protein J4E83_004821 [Alternaria metachromatica]KAI4622082.1 hypothetical protein J4E83_004821 [Alternaria metachromatica]
MSPRRLTFLLSLAVLGLGTLSSPLSGPALPLPARTVAQLPTVPTWLENIAVRPNGDLLVTQLAPVPILYTIKNPSLGNATLEPIYEFRATNVTDLLGITETAPDTYAIIAGNATTNSTGYAGTWSVWQATFASPDVSIPTVHKIANVPQAKLLNGAAALLSDPSIVMIVDSQYGLLFRLDTKTGTSDIIADGPEFKPYPELHNATVGFGANGIKIRNGFVYFSNSDLIAIYRVPITSRGYIPHNPKGGVELYANLTAVADFVDDFTFGPDGTLWAVSNYENTVIAVSPGGKKMEVVAGAKGSVTFAGDTAAAFGRTDRDRDVLYVSTAGGLAMPVNGSVVVPGSIVAVDTRGYAC